jgi:hypothetical protein
LTAPVNLNMKLLVRFLFALILIHPAITFSENKYSGNFQIKYVINYCNDNIIKMLDKLMKLQIKTQYKKGPNKGAFNI